MRTLRIALGVALALLVLPAAARAQAPSDKDLLESIGTKKDGWGPVMAKGLKAKMTPEQAGKVFPGAEKVSKFGFVDLPVEGKPGVVKLKFYFAKPKGSDKPTNLSKVTLIFDPKLTSDESFWKALVDTCQAKYGKIKDKKQVDKKLITWVGKKFKIAQLTKFPETGGDVYQLESDL